MQGQTEQSGARSIEPEGPSEGKSHSEAYVSVSSDIDCPELEKGEQSGARTMQLKGPSGVKSMCEQ